MALKSKIGLANDSAWITGVGDDKEEFDDEFEEGYEEDYKF
jgi:hypothetical protein